MDCIVCGTRPQIVYENLSDRLHPQIPGRYNLFACPQCGLMFISPQPTDAILKTHYPETYHVYQRDIEPIPARKLFFIKRVAKEYFGYGRPGGILSKIALLPFYFKLPQLPFYRSDGRLLDIGCGVGDRMQVFEALGWKVEGLEMDANAAKVAKKHGYKVWNTSLTEAKLPLDFYDTVHLNNVFEHLKDPHLALEKIRSILKDRGELIMVVPNAGSLAHRIFGKDWFALEVPRHLFTYNAENLSRLLQQHGFFEVKTVYNYTLGSLTSSAAYRLGKHVDTFAFLEKPLWVVSFIIDPIMNFFRIGDWMTIRSRVVK